MPAASPRPRIVPTGPESFLDELVAIDLDFFGGCCPDCRADHQHPIDERDELEGREGDDVALHPVLVRR